jgi:transketolase|tara:strand:- start:1813 stop:2301 length:489 start_codon:yes stop_codon:yes gene_type:complete
MRRDFAEKLHIEMGRNKDIYLLTGDLGYGLWDRIRIDYQDRFYNVGSSEQLMLGMASGLAMEGKIPVVYSITPFVLYRPFEFIRNYVDHEKLPVKLIGGGRDRDYGHFGFSHWAEEDKQIMKNFKNIKTLHPNTLDEMSTDFRYVIDKTTPVYMNLVREVKR